MSLLLLPGPPAASSSPRSAAFLKYGLLRSGLAHQVQLRETIVSDVPGTLEMLVPQVTAL